MVLLIMLFSLIGTVILIFTCGLFPTITITPEPPKTEITSPFVIEENIEEYNVATDIPKLFEEDNQDMKNEDLTDVFREGIVSKSIGILRSHGKSDDEIKAMMIKDFSLDEEMIDRLLREADSSN